MSRSGHLSVVAPNGKATAHSQGLIRQQGQGEEWKLSGDTTCDTHYPEAESSLLRSRKPGSGRINRDVGPYVGAKPNDFPGGRTNRGGMGNYIILRPGTMVRSKPEHFSV